MTLILASSRSGLMLADDSVDSGDVLYRSFAKVLPWREGYLGLAGCVAGASHVIATADSATTLEELSDVFVDAAAPDASVDGLLLLPWGLYLFDSYGMLLKVDMDYAAIGSGAGPAMAVMAYLNGTAPDLGRVCRAVAEVTTSVSDRHRTFALEGVGE